MEQDVSLRWIYVHMIEEYARHNGHADLLRERIDGAAPACSFAGQAGPNQRQSASCSAGAAVPGGSAVAAAQAMQASGRIRRASAGR